MHKKGFESPADITEIFIGIVLAAIGLCFLFLPASCEKSAKGEYFNKELVVLDHDRELLFLLQEPLGDGTIADQLILGEYGDARKTLAEKRLEDRINELQKVSPKGTKKSWMTLKVKGSREIYDDEPNLLKSLWYQQMTNRPEVFPSMTYLPSLDGSVIAIEKKSNVQMQVKLA
jgi:hypothetical protein